MGCVDRVPRRKYHSLLTLRNPGVGDPLNALMEVGETVSFGQKILPLGINYLEDFGIHTTPNGRMPVWKYVLPIEGSARLTLERFLEMDPDSDAVRIHYRLKGLPKEPLALTLEPFILFRPIHQLTRDNPFLNGFCRQEKEGVSIEPYTALPRLFMKVSGKPAVFSQAGRWEHGIFYPIEHARGYDANEDYFQPGAFHISLKSDTTVTFHCSAGSPPPKTGTKAAELPVRPPKSAEFPTALRAAAQQFLSSGGPERMIAGYPWFGSWMRDTLISLPGICLTTRSTVQAKAILETASAVFLKSPIVNAPAVADQPVNVMLDAPLLYIRAVQMLGKTSGKAAMKPFMPAVYHILEALRGGPDKGGDARVQVTPDGGLWVHPGPYTMTWMDACVNGRPVTPRHGFAVELNALLYNAMAFALDWAKTNKHAGFISAWEPIVKASGPSFLKRFWSAKHGYLADAHDGILGDFTLRPNQLWAVALPYSPVPEKTARNILEKIRENLVTPVGLRTLTPADERYKREYKGIQRDRDLAYHQGTVWPWLLGIYADALVRVHGARKMKSELQPVLDRLEKHFFDEACIGQISEVFDGDAPHAPGGAPAQAWSVAEVLRVLHMMGRR